MRFMVSLGVWLCVLVMNACTTVHDLDAPCTDFGKRCQQEPINSIGNPL